MEEYRREEGSESGGSNHESWKKKREAMMRECRAKKEKELHEMTIELREFKNRGTTTRLRSRFQDLHRFLTIHPYLQSIHFNNNINSKTTREKDDTMINHSVYRSSTATWIDCRHLSPRLLTALKTSFWDSYTLPSVIPTADIPLMLRHRDVFGFEDRGTPGKAFAFILPMLNYITRFCHYGRNREEEEAADDNDGPYAVVMAPTTELAQQIESEVLKLAGYLGIKVVSLVGTSNSIEREEKVYVMMIKEGDKMGRLTRLMDELRDKTALVFVNTEKVADDVTKVLEKEGYWVATFHGGKSWEHRETSLHGFRTGRYKVLVATDDVGCGGNDVPDVEHVINYDMPKRIYTYTHRIGRTGRDGKTGVSTTFLTSLNIEVFRDLKQLLIRSNSHVPCYLF